MPQHVNIPAIQGSAQSCVLAEGQAHTNLNRSSPGVPGALPVSPSERPSLATSLGQQGPPAAPLLRPLSPTHQVRSREKHGPSIWAARAQGQEWRGPCLSLSGLRWPRAQDRGAAAGAAGNTHPPVHTGRSELGGQWACRYNAGMVFLNLFSWLPSIYGKRNLVLYLTD